MSERIITIGTQKYTTVVCLDEPGAGGACHEYEIRGVQQNVADVIPKVSAKISFQNGPIKESGVNGCHNEDLIAIVIDRLLYFQSGEYTCRENIFALQKLEEALHWLRHRTNEREKRGVEGTHKK
jgi:hypothetical protein